MFIQKGASIRQQVHEDKKRIYNNHTTDNQNNKEVTAEILSFLLRVFFKRLRLGNYENKVMVLFGPNLKTEDDNYSMTHLLLCKLLQDREQITDVDTDQ